MVIQEKILLSTRTRRTARIAIKVATPSDELKKKLESWDWAILSKLTKSLNAMLSAQKAPKTATLSEVQVLENFALLNKQEGKFGLITWISAYNMSVHKPYLVHVNEGTVIPYHWAHDIAAMVEQGVISIETEAKENRHILLAEKPTVTYPLHAKHWDGSVSDVFGYAGHYTLTKRKK